MFYYFHVWCRKLYICDNTRTLKLWSFHVPIMLLTIACLYKINLIKDEYTTNAYFGVHQTGTHPECGPNPWPCTSCPQPWPVRQWGRWSGGESSSCIFTVLYWIMFFVVEKIEFGFACCIVSKLEHGCEFSCVINWAWRHNHFRRNTVLQVTNNFLIDWINKKKFQDIIKCSKRL